MAEPAPLPLVQAETLRDLADILIPGDAAFLAAGLIGVQAQLAARLPERDGKAGMPDLVAAHLLGTAWTDADPATSVVNKWHQSWDVPNPFIVDGSVFATGGVANPTPTIAALALRTADHIRDTVQALRGTTRALAT